MISERANPYRVGFFFNYKKDIEKNTLRDTFGFVLYKIHYIYFFTFDLMTKTVKLINTLNRTFNGVKPWKTIVVDAKNVDFYKNNWFDEIKQIIAEKTAQAQADAEAQAQAKADKEKADQEAQAQADAQAELDAEYNAKNGKDPEINGDANDDDDQSDAVDLDGEKADQEAQAGAETTADATVDATSDVDALTKELEKAPAPKKGDKKTK